MEIRNNVLVMVADNDIVDGKFVVPEGVIYIGKIQIVLMESGF